MKGKVILEIELDDTAETAPVADLIKILGEVIERHSPVIKNATINVGYNVKR